MYTATEVLAHVFTRTEAYCPVMSWDDRADRIEHEGAAYVYVQVADDLRTDMESGELPAGSKLPAAEALAEIYGVARLTAIRAVRHLEEQGLVTIVKGRGTYVTKGR